MANAPGRRLKVFQAQFGFQHSVVAASSQAAALRAWGTRQNLFAEGQARVTDDPQAIEAALAHPEIPLRRVVGSRDGFALEPTGVPSVPDAPKVAKARHASPKPERPVRPPADPTKLTDAETALHELDEARKREEADLRSQADAFEAKVAAAQSDYVAARKAGTTQVVAARQAYRKAGGQD